MKITPEKYKSLEIYRHMEPYIEYIDQIYGTEYQKIINLLYNESNQSS